MNVNKHEVRRYIILGLTARNVDSWQQRSNSPLPLLFTLFVSPLSLVVISCKDWVWVLWKVTDWHKFRPCSTSYHFSKCVCYFLNQFCLMSYFMKASWSHTNQVLLEAFFTMVLVWWKLIFTHYRKNKRNTPMLQDVDI